MCVGVCGCGLTVHYIRLNGSLTGAQSNTAVFICYCTTSTVSKCAQAPIELKALAILKGLKKIVHPLKKGGGATVLSCLEGDAQNVSLSDQ